MKLLPVIVLSLATAGAAAQGFITRTNDVHLDFSSAGVSSLLPSIQWISPSVETSFSQEKSLTVEVTLTSKEPIKEIRLIVTNGENEMIKKIPVEENTFRKTVTTPLGLMDGINTLEIVAETVRAGKVSSQRTVVHGKELVMEAVDANRKDFALIFATDKYDHWDDLVNPVSDARAIEKILKEKYGFETEVIENATLEETLGKLYDYNTKKFNTQDQLFIFFAGHGYFDPTLGEGYVVASNSLEDDKGKTTYIPHTVLRQRIDNIKCNHIFLTMDVCFGGTFDPLLTKKRGDVYAESSDSEYLAKKLSKRTRKYLTSGGMEYVADGVAGKHSPFAARFVQALREVGNGKDRLLTLPELETFFQKLPTDPRAGSFGSDESNSDFVFVMKQ
jgi:hypothetical protein